MVPVYQSHQFFYFIRFWVFLSSPFQQFLIHQPNVVPELLLLSEDLVNQSQSVISLSNRLQKQFTFVFLIFIEVFLLKYQYSLCFAMFKGLLATEFHQAVLPFIGPPLP